MQVVYESLTQQKLIQLLRPSVYKGYDRKKSERVLFKPLGAGGRFGGKGDFRISKVPLGILYYNIYYYYNSLTLH